MIGYDQPHPSRAFYVVVLPKQLWRQPNMLLWSKKKVYEEMHDLGYLVYQVHSYRPLIYRCAWKSMHPLLYTKPTDNAVIGWSCEHFSVLGLQNRSDSGIIQKK